MVESFGTEKFKYNGVDESEYGGGGGGASDIPGGKAKRGGVGGRGSKSNNHKEAKNANKRRFEKRERESKREQEEAKQKWIEEENRKYAPVDKKDQRHLAKM